MNNRCSLSFRKVAILGAGVMGSQIAALLADAGIAVILMDLPAKEGNPNGIVLQALKRLQKLKPAPLMLPSLAHNITPANYDQHLDLLEDCDLIIEAIAERIDLKEQLYNKIAPYLSDTAILASNTSGLSINTLLDSLPKELHTRFCGIHFFNPPRYMHLVELIPSAQTDSAMLDVLEAFLVTHLGKGVIRAKDTPNFIANRVGVFAILNAMHYTEKFKLGFDQVDAVSGPLIGRPKSATYRTMDVVGIDVLGHVVETMLNNLQDDPWLSMYELPAWVKALIETGALGQKAGAGVYRKDGKQINVLDLASKTYRAAAPYVDDEVKKILYIANPAEKLEKLRQCEKPQAQFLWSVFCDVFHYCAVHGPAIADNVRDIDLALRWGFGWQQGPFEMWQACGWQTVTDWINEDIKSGKTSASVALPDWVNQVKHVYDAAGAYNFHTGKQQAWSNLDVYQRQIILPAMVGQDVAMGKVIHEDEFIRFWHMDDGIAIASFKTKNNIISSGVIKGLTEMIPELEKSFKGLIIWQGDSDNFCFGADLKTFGEQYVNDIPGLRKLVASFQSMVLTMRYARIPVVSAVKGMVLGGGVEICLHSDKVIAAAESYIGLVEAGVGILPAGAGSKELALRAANYAGVRDPFPKIQQFFEQVAMAKVATSALEARAFHYLRDSDEIIMNSDELLYAAKASVNAMSAAGYRPPVPPTIRVVGRPGIATLQMILANMREGHFISDYDYYLATKIATVLCGGDVQANTMVDEQWMLNLELESFVELAQQEKTMQRIMHTLKTGKPLRN